MEKTILIGNGVNIQFSDDKSEYTNSQIIKRTFKNLKKNADKYYKIFNGTVNASDLIDCLTILIKFYNTYVNKGLNYKNIVNTNDEFISFFNMIELYKDQILKPEDMSMEYYFLLADLYNNYYNNKNPNSDKININSIFEGFRYIFVDAIYNDEAIEDIYKNMYKFANELNTFDNIFTINYDNNLDKIANKQVYHLHGNFNTIQDRFNPKTVLGYINSHSNKSVEYIKKYSHIFSNAVMGFSGKIKVGYLNIYNESSHALKMYIDGLKDPNDYIFHKKYNELKKSDKEIDKAALLVIDTKLKHPELTYTEYPIDEFKNIFGSLTILGMSPNNDSHIIKMINDNDNISRVVYYYLTNEERNYMTKVINKERHLICKRVDKYWKSIGC